MKFSTNSFFIFTGLVFISWINSDCRKDFAGKWKYKNISPDSTYVMRTLEKQFEYVDHGKYYYEFSVRWLDDCSYQLTYIGTTSPRPAAIQIGESLHVDILSINNTRMTYKTIFRNLQESDEMEKIQ
ncbi:MAG TPA: hypothetical protein VKR53_20475 [Puia sp.]|nr:hypothetical protein [Puia sp.]